MLYAIVAVIILILDQATKYWTNVHLTEGAASPFIPGLIQLTNVHNKGAAFSFLEGGRWFFVALTLVVAIAVIILLSRNIIKGKLGRWMLVMVVAGGLGNCIDRTLYGYVVDMFQFQFKIFGGDFAIFNVSDIFITICGLIFCIYLIFHKEPEKTPAPVRAPSRAMPAERPVRADYITQLKKPTVEGRRNIEAEIAAKTAEASISRNSEDVITDWNMPEEFVSEK
ncbi:MAG: signal peptidase II, partial [Oscillospiraceae bacterium]